MTSASPPSLQPLILLLAPSVVKKWAGGFIPSWKAPENLPSAHFLRDDEILVFLGQICVTSRRSYFKHKSSKEKQRMYQCIQDEIKAQQMLHKFHQGLFSEQEKNINSYLWHNRSISQLQHSLSICWCPPVLLLWPPIQPQVLELIFNPGWGGLGCFWTFPQRAVWSGVLPSGNRAALDLLLRTFDHFLLQDLFPHPCLHDRASKDTVLFPLTALTSSTPPGLEWVCAAFLHADISIHYSHLICVSADHRGSMDWPLQDALDQFSFRMKHKLLITPGTQTRLAPKVSCSLQKI